MTVAVTRVVKPGCEEAFERAIHGFVQRSLHLPGQLGVQILRPVPGSGSREYGILRRFASAEARDEFYRLPLFDEWKQKVAGLVEGEPRYERLSGLEDSRCRVNGPLYLRPAGRWLFPCGLWPFGVFVRYEHLSGLETWFTLPGQRAIVPPPRWKMALVTVLGVWPASMFVPWLLHPFISGLVVVAASTFCGCGDRHSSHLGDHAGAGKNSQAVAVIACKGGNRYERT